MGCLMVASNQGSDEGGKMHMRMHIHTACYPFHTRECAAIVITSLRAYELTAAAARFSRAVQILKPARALSSVRYMHIGFTMHEAM
jgi:hypothetical protein